MFEGLWFDIIFKWVLFLGMKICVIWECDMELKFCKN